MLVDLHCHTTRSQDSRLSPELAIAAARAAGLDAVCLTEHDDLWAPGETQDLSAATGFPVFAGVEVSTEIGHVLAFGLGGFDLGLRSFPALVTRARESGAALVLAHPYRRRFRFEVPAVLTGPDIEAALGRRGLADVAAVEAGNGGTRPVENRLAAEVAARRGLPTTAGSDAHAPERVGIWATEVDDGVRDSRDLAAAIAEGGVRSVLINDRGGREGR